MKKPYLFALGIIFISFITAIYLYPQMPDEMAIHWNAQGEADGYASKIWGLFLTPCVSLGIFVLLTLIPKIDPLKRNIEKFRKYFDWFIVILISFLLYIHFLTIFWSLNVRFDMMQMLIPAFSILFYCSGMLLKKCKRNWIIGIRTPWTLSNDIVWNKTHQIGGKLFKTVGIISFLGIIFFKYAIWFLIVPVIATSLYLMIYSYFEYQKQVKNK